MGGKERGSPQRSITSSRTPRRDGYYLECRKDAQCDCSMCKASITATLDLRPPPTPLFGSILTNRLESPSLFGHSLIASGKENQPWALPASTPRSAHLLKNTSRFLNTEGRHTAETISARVSKARNRIRVLSGLLLFLLLGFTWPWPFSSVLEPRLSPESFTRLAEASLVRRRLLDRLDFVQRQISRASIAPSLSNCTGCDSTWRLAEDGHLLHSACEIYASPLEKVSVWGYAAKTGGVLGRSLVDRSFTVLAGRVMEWPEGQIEYIVHPEGSSWTMRRWAASAIVLDGNTWILEYKRTPLCEGFGSFHGLLHLARSGLAKILSNIKLFIDTAFFVHMQGLDIFALSPSTRLPPT